MPHYVPYHLPGGVSGGARVFVDQAAQDGFSVDPFVVEVGNGEVATVVFTAGDALGEQATRRPTPGTVGGRPGWRHLLVPYSAGIPAQQRVLPPEHEQLGIFRLVAAEHPGRPGRVPGTSAGRRS